MQHTVKVEGFRLKAFVGVYDEEKVLGNDIEVNAAITVDIDNSNKIVDYEQVAVIIREILETPHNYLEDVNGLIIQEIRFHFPQANKIVINTNKLHVPFLKGQGRAGVKSVWNKPNKKEA